MERIKVKKGNLIEFFCAILLLVVLIPPEGIFFLFPPIGSILNYLRVFICVIIAFVYMFFCLVSRKLILTKGDILLLCFFGYNIFLTIIKNHSLKEDIMIYGFMIIVIILFELFRGNLLLLFDGIFIYLFFINTINTLCVVVFPQGLYVASNLYNYTSNWLLGYKSSFSLYCLPLTFFSLFNILSGRKRIVSYLSIVLSLIGCLMAGNIICSVCIIFIITTYKLNIIKKLSVLLNPIYFIAIFGFLNYSIITLSILSSKYISFIILNILKKDVQFSGRTLIWKLGVEEIKKNILFGNGYVEDLIKRSKFLGFNHLHNNCLEVLFQGGVIWLIFYACIVCYILIKIKKNINNSLSSLLGIYIISIQILSLVEIILHRFDILNWMIIILALNIDSIKVELTNNYI